MTEDQEEYETDIVKFDGRHQVATTEVAPSALMLAIQKGYEPALIEKAAQTASEEARPITDVRASAEYRKEMVNVFTRRAIMQLAAK